MASGRSWPAIAAVIAGVVIGSWAVPGPVAPPSAYADVPAAQAASAATRYQVTFAARTCADYSQVMIGRVRDDGIEAAALLGKSNVYTDGHPVDPDVEARADCQPLTGWRFTLGSGHQRDGAAPSAVTGVLGEAGPTVDSVPRLDQAGQPVTGSLAVAGAVTVTLTEDQVANAMRRQLWVQGGRPNDPLLGNGKLAFAALRCAVDGRSGGNTQWVAFPSGIRHVFCFAYYVSAASPGAAAQGVATGTIIVKTKLTRPVGYTQRFTFTASFGYAETRTFALTSAADGASASFARVAGGDMYQLYGAAPPEWSLSDLACDVAPAAGARAAGTTTVDLASGRADIKLGAKETTTCTYTFAPPAVPPGLSIRVFSDGGGGSFGVTATSVTSGASWSLAASPQGDGSAVTATGADLTALEPGTYTVTVAPPAVSSGGGWQLQGGWCSGAELTPSGLGVTVPVAAGVPVECVLRVGRPAVGLRLRVITVGASGSGAFAVVPVRSSTTGWSAVGTTTSSGHASDASGDVPAALPAGDYLVTAVSPRTTADAGWKLATFDCGSSEASHPSIMDPDEAGDRPPGPVIVTLKAGLATPVCTATWRFARPTRMQIVLRAAGEPGGRSTAAVTEVSCVDGSTGRVVLAPDDDAQEESLPTPLTFLAATACVITQRETGVAANAKVDTAITLDPAAGNASLNLPATVTVSRDVDTYTATLVETFQVTGASPRASAVLKSFQLLPVVLLGAGVAGFGVLILLLAAARWRRGARNAE